MQLPTEIWYNVFSFLSQKSMSKFNSLLNLHNFDIEEIELLHDSNDLWFDIVRKGYIKSMKFLIKAGGININKQDNYNSTALHIASNRSYKDIVELLIKAGGININKQNNGGWTALHLASYNSHEKIVELLIKAGADINIQDNNNYTAFDWANMCSHKEIVELLEKTD